MKASAFTLCAMLAAGAASRAEDPLWVMPAPLVGPQQIDAPFASQRTGLVRLDPAVLRDLPDGQEHRLRLDILPDRSHTAVLKQRQLWGPGSVIWTGVIDGSTGSSVSAVFHGGSVNIDIQILGQPNLAITPYKHALRPDVYVVRELDDDACGCCGNGPAQQNHAPAQVPPAAPAAEEGALIVPLSNSTPGTAPPISYIDVLILYSDVARADAGSKTAIELRALSMHSAANDTHANSNTDVRLRLVGIEEVTYDEDGDLETHLDWLRDQGRLTTVVNGQTVPNPAPIATMRKALGADLVCMLIEDQGRTGSPDVIGLAFKPTPGDPNHDYHERKGFSVVKWDSDTLVYAHELGHNLGCDHEEIVSPPDPNMGYNHADSMLGYWDLGVQNWSQNAFTVMDAASSSEVVRHFSNPEIDYTLDGGDCAGLPESFCPDQDEPTGTDYVVRSILGLPPFSVWADNARFIRENRSSVACYLQPVFYGDPGGTEPARATALDPEDDLDDILVQWYDRTEAHPSMNADVYLRAGTYSDPITIDKAVTLRKWEGSGDVRIGG